MWPFMDPNGRAGKIIAPAGPVWAGDTALVSDGSVYLTGPSLSLTRPVTVVLRADISVTTLLRSWFLRSAGGHYLGSFHNSSQMYSSMQGSGSSGYVSAAAGAGSYLFANKFVANTPYISKNGAAFYSNVSATGTITTGDGVFYVLSGDGTGTVLCPSGLSLYEIAFYSAALSDADISALYNSGTPADFRTLIATQPDYYLDMAANQDDGASGWEVLDLMGGAAAAVVGGDGGNFA